VADTINIVVIEDNPGDVRLVEESTRNNYIQTKLFVADCLARGLKYIAAEHIDVILLDLNLPDSRGIETFRQTHKFENESLIRAIRYAMWSHHLA
jgi:DNA-binding response OmpR family regulator